jgi:hypothetical protein
MPFKKLFRSPEKSPDGLTQNAREAIVDVLHFCMYADKHIAIREDEFIEKAARTLNWDANISYDYYEGKSIGAVSRALADKDACEHFFDSLKNRLTGKPERDLALRLAEGLAKSDDKTVQSEVNALIQLRSVLS